MKRNEKGQFIKGQVKDWTGVKRNMLTFLELDHIRKTEKTSRPYWKVLCECGNVVVKDATSVSTGYSKSCGCLQKIATSKARKIHGEADTRLYYIWENMKKRCFSENSDRYKNYGGRGITVAPEWLDYVEFSKWAKESGYEEHLTLERIDLNKNYEPSNCTWITQADQAKNRTTNKWVYIDGVKYSPLELEEKFNIPVKTLYARIARGDEGESVVRPLGKRQFRKR